MNKIAKYVTFKGRVQGVGFRFTALSIANQHKLTGYIRNMPDGSVEMLAQGAPDQIDACIDEIADNYRPNITEVTVNQTPTQNNQKSFRITF